MLTICECGNYRFLQSLLIPSKQKHVVGVYNGIFVCLVERCINAFSNDWWLCRVADGTCCVVNATSVQSLRMQFLMRPDAL